MGNGSVTLCEVCGRGSLPVLTENKMNNSYKNNSEVTDTNVLLHNTVTGLQLYDRPYDMTKTTSQNKNVNKNIRPCLHVGNPTVKN